MKNTNNDDVRRANTERPAVDREAARRQDEVKANHDALEAQARRVESSVSADVRSTPIGEMNRSDFEAAANQSRVHADHDAMEASARRVSASVSTSSEDATDARRRSAEAHENAEAARRNNKR